MQSQRKFNGSVRSSETISATLCQETKYTVVETTESVSVVICCYNSAARLPETLRHLAEQKIPQGMEWEIVVVDNASTDDTAAVAEHFAATHSDLSVRIVPEPKPGTMYARIRGLKEARGTIILFVDDDNWLESEYVALVAETMRSRPEIAALGGMSTAEYEQEPPEWIARHQRWYAVSGLPEATGGLTEETFLWTAGTSFRRSALEQVADNSLRVSGRKGTTLQAGEDAELCCRLRLRGHKLFCHPSLRFRHYLPAQRVQWGYLRRMCYAAGEVSVLLDVYRFRDTKSRWSQWLLRSWHAQILDVYSKLLRHPFVFRRAAHGSIEGNDQVLRIEIFRGRLAALKRARGSYGKMLGGASDPVESKALRRTDGAAE
jgi:glycosyltransferase involved in cell wall biosynthesis